MGTLVGFLIVLVAVSGDLDCPSRLVRLSFVFGSLLVLMGGLGCLGLGLGLLLALFGALAV